ncbi:MAG: hypothetical protein JRH20_19930, partial [Deltaproteobacteria bacterium]|nr:hypothetical protein [Deltaproteobacteria bacterium]
MGSPIHHDCHERLLFMALQRAATLPGFPAQATHDDEVLAHALQFDVSPYGKDLLTISLMLGVRYNDLHGKQATEVGELAPVHNDEAYQDEHCLRRSLHDGEDGGVQATAECQLFIRQRVEQALAGKDLPDARF